MPAPALRVRFVNGSFVPHATKRAELCVNVMLHLYTRTCLAWTNVVPFHSITVVNRAGKGVRSQNQGRFLCLKTVPYFLCDLLITNNANLISQNMLLFQLAELFFLGCVVLYTTSNLFWKWVGRRLQVQTSSVASFTVHLLSCFFWVTLFDTALRSSQTHSLIHSTALTIRPRWGGRFSKERIGTQQICTEIHFGRNARRALKLNVGG